MDSIATKLRITLAVFNVQDRNLITQIHTRMPVQPPEVTRH